MCHWVDVLRSGKKVRCKSVGELADALNIPPEQLSSDPPNTPLADQHNARLRELGARIATINEGWPFPYYIITLTP